MQMFYVADLGDDHMLLGMPFLSAKNPKINWTSGTFRGKIEVWTLNVHHRPFLPLAIRAMQMKEMLQSQFINSGPTIWQTTKSTALTAVHADTTKQHWKEVIPTEYHKFGKVFSEKASQRLPARRPWNHAIKLSPDASATLDCKTYPLAQGQQKLLDEFLAKHLAKGYIRQSKSPYALPFFFVGKKSTKTRPVQDYHVLNNFTICNNYPLPLIKELISQLVGKQWFTKFDIQWGYNNVQMKEGDEWKATFKTNRGLFEPLVMFFGLTNSPATFQTMMDSIFKEEIASRDVIIYMDDIFIATTRNLKSHSNLVTHVLKKLQDYDLFLWPEKCHFHKEECYGLGLWKPFSFFVPLLSLLTDWLADWYDYWDCWLSLLIDCLLICWLVDLITNCLLYADWACWLIADYCLPTHLLTYSASLLLLSQTRWQTCIYTALQSRLSPKLNLV
jgi:hypothetical protein